MTEATNIDPAIAAIISERLDAVERDHKVRILFAIESGSRAWGFPSPDSDYDVRFVYVHDPDWYLSLDERRDVIELPIEGDLDINGWDLRKALNLLLKPNPVLLEWLRSPILYRAEPASFAALADLALETHYQRPSQYHYLHIARSQYLRFIEGNSTVRLKKYFYVIRPVLALMWLRENSNRPLPMSLPEMRHGLALPTPINAFLDDLLHRKAVSKELGIGPRNPDLDAIIETEMAVAEAALADQPKQPAPLFDQANWLFRRIVRNQPTASNREPATGDNRS